MKKFLVIFIPSVAVMLLLFIFGIIFSSSPINLCTDYVYKNTSSTSDLYDDTIRFGLDGKYTVIVRSKYGTEKYTNLYDINGDEIVLYNWNGSGSWTPLKLTIKDKNTLSYGFESKGNGWEIVCWLFFSVLFIGNSFALIRRIKTKHKDNNVIATEKRQGQDYKSEGVHSLKTEEKNEYAELNNKIRYLEKQITLLKSKLSIDEARVIDTTASNESKSLECPFCGKPISLEDEECSFCGFDLKNGTI